MFFCDESLWQDHVSQEVQWWAMAFIYMLTSLYSIPEPGWQKSNSVKLQQSTWILYCTSEGRRAWIWKVNSHGTASSRVSHSTQLTWKCLCWKHMGHVLLGPLYWESMLWRKAFPARRVFMHNLKLKWEFGIARFAHKQNSHRDNTQSGFAYPSHNVLPTAPSPSM